MRVQDQLKRKRKKEKSGLMGWRREERREGGEDMEDKGLNIFTKGAAR